MKICNEHAVLSMSKLSFICVTSTGTSILIIVITCCTWWNQIPQTFMIVINWSDYQTPLWVRSWLIYFFNMVFWNIFNLKWKYFNQRENGSWIFVDFARPYSAKKYLISFLSGIYYVNNWFRWRRRYRTLTFTLKCPLVLLLSLVWKQLLNNNQAKKPLAIGYSAYSWTDKRFFYFF